VSGAAGIGGTSASGGREPRAGSSNGGNSAQGGTLSTAGQAPISGSGGEAIPSHGGGGYTASGGAAGHSGGAGGVAGRGGAGAGAGGMAGRGGAGAGAGGMAGRGGAGTGASGAAGSGGGTGGSGTAAAASASAGHSGDGGTTGGSGGMCSTSSDMPPAAACGITGKVALEYLADVASASQLSFSVRLRTASWHGAVPLNQIEVQYYLSLEEESGFQAQVDSFASHGPGPSADHTATSQISIVKLEPAQKSSSVPGACQTHFIRIRNTSSAQVSPPTQAVDSYFEFHVTLTANNPAPPNQVHTNDQSYRPSSTIQGNTGMGVLLCGQLVSGCTPGDAGTCG
jgi:hypothetical protein